MEESVMQECEQGDSVEVTMSCKENVELDRLVKLHSLVRDFGITTAKVNRVSKLISSVGLAVWVISCIVNVAIHNSLSGRVNLICTVVYIVTMALRFGSMFFLAFLRDFYSKLSQKMLMYSVK